MGTTKEIDATGRAGAAIAILRGETTSAEVSAKYEVSPAHVEDWVKKFLAAGTKSLAGGKLSDWFERRRNQKLHRQIGFLQRIELSSFEVLTLVPTIKGQLEYITEIFQQIQATAKDPSTAKAVAFPLSKVLPKPSSDVDKDAVAFLSSVAAQCQTDFIEPINTLLADSKLVTDMPSLLSWLTQVKLRCSSLLRTRTTLFVLAHRSFATKRDPKTGEVDLEPDEFSVVVYPFNIRVLELVTIAEAIDGSISLWHKELFEARSKLLEFRTSHEHYRGSRNLLWFETLVVIASLALVAGGIFVQDMLGLRQQNHELKADLIEHKANVEALELSSKRSHEQIVGCENNLREARADCAADGRKTKAPKTPSVDPQRANRKN